MEISSDVESKYEFEEEWDQLIAKHRIRPEIWVLLELHHELMKSNYSLCRTR